MVGSINLEYVPGHFDGTIIDAYDHHGVKEDNEKAPHRVKIMNIFPTTKAKTVFDVFKRYRAAEFLSCVYIFQKEAAATAIIRFRDSDEVLQGARDFIAETDWQWNGGFRARLAGITRMFSRMLKYELLYIEGTSRAGSCRDTSVEFFGGRVDNALAGLSPGCIVSLPKVENMPEGELVDVRLKRGVDIAVLGHPVVIIKVHGNGMVNFVVCTTLHGESPEYVFRNRPSKLREFVQIESLSETDRAKRKKNGIPQPDPDNILSFEGGAHMPRRGWAGTKVYTISVKCLVSLDLPYLDDQPGGCMKLRNVDLLINRMRRLGCDPEAEYVTSKFPVADNLKFRTHEDGGAIWIPGPWSGYKKIDRGEWINPPIL